MSLDLILRIVSTLSTLGIGVAASLLAYQQFKISRSKLKFDLYERRLKLFTVVKEFCGRTAVEGEISTQQSSALYHDTIERHFLFDKEISDYIGDVYVRAKRVQGLKLQLESPNLSDDEREQLNEQHTNELTWFYNQAENMPKVFFSELAIRTLK